MKTRTFHMRLTEAEAASLAAAAKAAGTSMSGFVLACIQGDRLFLSIDRELLASTRLELARQGNNLNQIAWRLNSLARTNALSCADAIADVERSQEARVAAYRAVQRALALEGRR